MKLSDFVLEFLIKNKVEYLFNFAGGSIAHLMDSLYLNKRIKSFVVHHEQAGAFSAEGYSRITGNIGAVMATSGPGATNMITGMASSFFDSIPMLYLTGQVNTYEYKYTDSMRQRGFQETDIVSIVKPITKFAYRITDPMKIRYILEEAVYTAKNGRPGPVLIDIPLNIQRAEIDIKKLPSFYKSAEYIKLKKVYFPPLPAKVKNDISLLIEKLKKAERPLILVGGGIRASGNFTKVREFLSFLNIPVVSSLLGLDVFEHTNKYYVGMIGVYGNRQANITLANCDLLIVLGARLDTRQTGTKPETFAREADIFHIEIDKEELKYRKFKHYHPVNLDLNLFLNYFNKKVKKAPPGSNINNWLSRIQKYKEKYSKEKDYKSGVDIYRFFTTLSKSCGKKASYILDVGQHQMWAAQSLILKKNDRLLTCGGLGAMGFGLPASIGAYLADKKAVNILITGDGGIQVNLHELETADHYSIPLKIIVMNNGCLGMVREFQEIYFKKRYQSTVKGYSCVSLEKIANAFNFKYLRIESNKDLDKKIKDILDYRGKILVEVVLPQTTNVYPKLIVNHPIEDQSPFIKKEKLIKDMIVKPFINKDK